MYSVIGPDGQETSGLDLATLQDWVAGGQLPKQAVVIRPDKSRVTAGMMDELVGFYGFAPAPAASSGFDSLIPTKNPKSLLAYYFGYGAMIPVLGIFFAPFVIVWARQGLAAYRSNPQVHGKGHSITGIVFASIGLLINVPLWGIIIVSGFNSAK